ncbi:OLC1v1009305C2 [Oldenlandia corymbosa var. corymbosa]|uniref:OLC1v1009305C2 n=1 Tax=Oldenlandia corymbosa var. corymbosa TaxID=529605 RepID=A0AAV1DNM7_OLDCO|nr:OLC1v1009305C2 [Oldenlandia corymbosa var. corymbosa]
MLTSICRHNFQRKFRTLVALCVDRPHGYCRIATKCDPTMEKPKHQTPVRRIVSKKKQSKLMKRGNVEPKVYMRETIWGISKLLRYYTWESAQEQLEKLAIKWDSYTVNQVLKTHPPMEKTWLFFNWASRKKGFKHDQYTYTTMLDIFGEARRIESMKYVFHQMQEQGIKIDVVTYTSLLHWLSNDGDVDGATALWKEMRDKGCHPTTVSYTAYMKILFDHNRVREATEVYKEMIRVGCSPNCHTYTILMEHLANSGRFKEAMDIFNKMQVAGVQPDKAACNILVSKCCKAMELESMQKILEYMRDKTLVLRISVYREAIETLKAAGASDALLRQVNRHLSCENFDQKETDRHIKEIIDIKSAMDRAVVLHFLKVSSHNCRESSALLAVEYSSKVGIMVERSAYLALFGLLIRTNKLAKVVNVVEEMIRAGVSPGSQQSALLVYRLGLARELDLAAKVFSLLPDEEKNTATYTALIAAFFSSGETEKGLGTFELMRTLGIGASLGTYRVLLNGLEKTGQIGKLETYRKEKKILQAKSCTQNVSPEEKICDLLFAGDFFS